MTLMQFNWSFLAATGLILFVTGCGQKAAVTNDTTIAATNSDGEKPVLPAASQREAAAVPPTKQKSNSEQPKVAAAEAAVPAPAIDDEIRQPATVAEAAKAI